MLFVSEYLTCGACSGEELPASLAAEGRAMALAVMADLVHCGHDVTTTWDARLSLPDLPGVNVVRVNSPDEERNAFCELAGQAAGTLVIAPEFEDILWHRQCLTAEAGGTWLGCSPEAIELCSDKLECARHLSAWAVPTVETCRMEEGPCHRLPWPRVIKPRCGAGTLNTFLVRTAEEWQSRVLSEYLECPPTIEQPFIPGTPLSTAALFGRGRVQRVLTVGRQNVQEESGRFHYTGGEIGAPNQADTVAVQDLVAHVGGVIPGLHGWVGFDLIRPEGSEDYLLLEINPRLTTAYIGYRQIYGPTLAEHIIKPATPWQLPGQGSARFCSSGISK